MPKRHRDLSSAEFDSYLEGELLVGLRDSEKSISYQELERQLGIERADAAEKSHRLRKHARRVRDLVEALHQNNDDLRKVHKRVRADAFSYAAEPGVPLYEGGLSATWTPDPDNSFRGTFTFDGAAGFTEPSDDKSWFPLKHVPTDRDFSEYDGFEFTVQYKVVGGTPGMYPAVMGYRKSVKCEHRLDADSTETHYQSPGNMYFRKKACDQPPADAVINFAGKDKDLLFSIRPGFRMYAKMVNKMPDGTDRTVSDIQCLDVPKAIVHMSEAEIAAVDDDAQKWAPTKTRWVFNFDNIEDPKDNSDAYYVDKNQGTFSGSAAPRRYHTKSRYPQNADPLADGVTNAHGKVGYGKLCPRDNVQSLQITPYFKMGTWIGATEQCEIEISDVKLFKFLD